MMSWLQYYPNVFLGPDRGNHWRAGGRNTTWGSILTRPAGRPGRLGHGQEDLQLGVLLLSRDGKHWAHVCASKAYAMWPKYLLSDTCCVIISHAPHAGACAGLAAATPPDARPFLGDVIIYTL